MTSCPHMNFAANVTVNRLEDTGRFIAEVTINCEDCGEKFQFLGLEPGLKLAGASVSLTGQVAHLSILPDSQAMSPMARMMANAEAEGGAA